MDHIEESEYFKTYTCQNCFKLFTPDMDDNCSFSHCYSCIEEGLVDWEEYMKKLERRRRYLPKVNKYAEAIRP